MARITGTVLAAAVSLVLAACGGGSGDTTASTRTDAERVRIVEVARDYTAAFVDGDYARACALLTPAARARFADAAPAAGGGSCAALLEAAAGAVPADERAGTRAVRATLVSAAGDRARVRTTVEGQRDTVALTRVGGRWLIDASL